MTKVRFEQHGDETGIRAIHRAAFPDPAEAELVDALRNSGRLLLSMAAEQGSRLVGHVAFSPVTTASAGGWGLAPVAVLPDCQRQGIASRLIREALLVCTSRQIPFVVVLGAPHFYSRFGFEPAPHYGLTDEYGGGDAFQIWAPRPELIPRNHGLVRYSPEFGVFSDEPHP
jgi:putative acetyltransferase